MLSQLEKFNSASGQFNVDIAEKVTEFCLPLFNHFDITNFGYVKLLSDGKMYRLATDKTWNQHYFDKQFYNDVVFYDFLDVPVGSVKTKIFTGNYYKEGATQAKSHFQSLYEHDIWNIFTLYQRNMYDVEVWFFASTRDNEHIVNFYLNHQTVLEEFIKYFRLKAQPIITSMKDSDLIKTELTLAQPKLEMKRSIEKFIAELKHNTTQLQVKLTERERECLGGLIEGHSSKEIARILNISPRTVQRHIDHIRHKTQCRKITEIVRMFYTGAIEL